jgi:hypothetical protein
MRRFDALRVGLVCGSIAARTIEKYPERGELPMSQLTQRAFTLSMILGDELPEEVPEWQAELVQKAAIDGFEQPELSSWRAARLVGKLASRVNAPGLTDGGH